MRDYYIRQLWDANASAPIETMPRRVLESYAEMCGWALAHAHARSGYPMAISSYLGQSDAFDRAMTGFADAYADQNERDYEALEEAAASSRFEVEMGV